jgi:hypothetical protein
MSIYHTTVTEAQKTITTAHDAHMARQSEASEQYQNAQAVAAAAGWGHTLLPNNQHYAEGNKRMRAAMDAMPTADSKQVSGNHYKDMPIQPWAVMESVLTHAEFIGYLKGNIIKYSLRAGRKEGSDDAGKAEHYMEKLNEVRGY